MEMVFGKFQQQLKTNLIHMQLSNLMLKLTLVLNLILFVHQLDAQRRKRRVIQ
jgi:hypothetical protein